jgi:hypothetical protein
VSNKGRAQFFARSLVESADRFALNDWRFFFSESAVGGACHARTCGARLLPEIFFAVVLAGAAGPFLAGLSRVRGRLPLRRRKRRTHRISCPSLERDFVIQGRLHRAAIALRCVLIADSGAMAPASGRNVAGM